MTKPFKIRCVFGEFKGQWFSGVVNGIMPEFTKECETAEKVDAASASSIVMACIDRCIVVVPEMTESANDTDTSETAGLLAKGCWVNPSSEMIEFVSRCIRNSSESPIHDQPPEFDKPCRDSGFMSVFEWIRKAVAANNKF